MTPTPSLTRFELLPLWFFVVELVAHEACPVFLPPTPSPNPPYPYSTPRPYPYPYP